VHVRNQRSAKRSARRSQSEVPSTLAGMRRARPEESLLHPIIAKDFPDLLAQVAAEGTNHLSGRHSGHIRRRQVRTRISRGSFEAVLRFIRVAHPLLVNTLEREMVALRQSISYPPPILLDGMAILVAISFACPHRPG
jgi:hypothetical protein